MPTSVLSSFDALGHKPLPPTPSTSTSGHAYPTSVCPLNVQVCSPYVEQDAAKQCGPKKLSGPPALNSCRRAAEAAAQDIARSRTWTELHVYPDDQSILPPQPPSAPVGAWRHECVHLAHHSPKRTLVPDPDGRENSVDSKLGNWATPKCSPQVSQVGQLSGRSRASPIKIVNAIVAKSAGVSFESPDRPNEMISASGPPTTATSRAKSPLLLRACLGDCASTDDSLTTRAFYRVRDCPSSNAALVAAVHQVAALAGQPRIMPPAAAFQAQASGFGGLPASAFRQPQQHAPLASKVQIKGLLTLDEQTTEILIANDVVSSMFGIDANALIGLKFSDLIKIGSQPINNLAAARNRNGTAITFTDDSLINKEKKLRPVYGKVIEVYSRGLNKHVPVSVWSYPILTASANTAIHPHHDQSNSAATPTAGIFSSALREHNRVGQHLSLTGDKMAIGAPCSGASTPGGRPTVVTPCHHDSTITSSEKCSSHEKVSSDRKVCAHLNPQSTLGGDSDSTPRRWLVLLEPVDRIVAECTLGLKGRIFCSTEENLAQLFGYERTSDMLGMDLCRLVPSFSIQRVADVKPSTSAGKSSTKPGQSKSACTLCESVCGKSKCGAHFPLSYEATAVRDEDTGELIKYEVRLCAYAALAGVLAVHRDGRLHSYNDHFVHSLLGYEPGKDNLHSTPISALIPTFCDESPQPAVDTPPPPPVPLAENKTESCAAFDAILSEPTLAAGLTELRLGDHSRSGYQERATSGSASPMSQRSGVPRFRLSGASSSASSTATTDSSDDEVAVLTGAKFSFKVGKDLRSAASEPPNSAGPCGHMKFDFGENGARIVEGAYAGYARHRDGGLVAIWYEVSQLRLRNGVLLYSVWIYRDQRWCTATGAGGCATVAQTAAGDAAQSQLGATVAAPDSQATVVAASGAAPQKQQQRTPHASLTKNMDMDYFSVDADKCAPPPGGKPPPIDVDSQGGLVLKRIPNAGLHHPLAMAMTQYNTMLDSDYCSGTELMSSENSAMELESDECEGCGVTFEVQPSTSKSKKHLGSRSSSVPDFKLRNPFNAVHSSGISYNYGMQLRGFNCDLSASDLLAQALGSSAMVGRGKLRQHSNGLSDPANIQKQNTLIVDDNNLMSGPYSEKYDTLHVIGKGAFGSVRLAVKKNDGMFVIAKLISRQKVLAGSWVRDERWPAAVPIEIHLLTRVRHPNVVKVLDVFQNDNSFQMVMEKHGSGMDLFEFIERRPNLDEPLASYMFRQIVSAVSYLHLLGVCHRDIKDENVIVDNRFNCKLIDFGSAAYFGSGRQFSTFCGTIEYCAPEVLAGNRYAGPEVEMWSLGVLLYTLIFFENPFATANDTIRARLYLPKCSASLRQLIDWLLKADPGKRATVMDAQQHGWCAIPVDINRYVFERVVENHEQHEVKPPTFATDLTPMQRAWLRTRVMEERARFAGNEPTCLAIAGTKSTASVDRIGLTESIAADGDEK